MARLVDVQVILTEVENAARRAVNQTSRIALAKAIGRAPVRKVFKGGRNSPSSRYHTLTDDELRAEARQLDTGQELTFANKATQRQYDAARASGISIEDALVRIRRGTQVAPRQSNRANTTTGSFPMTAGGATYRVSSVYRRGLKLDEDNEPMRELAFSGARASLSVRGRYELASGRSISPSGRLGGSLRESIHQERRDSKGIVKTAIVAGGHEAPYARFVEFGTRHAPAQPFLRPALKEVEGNFPMTMRAELRKMGR